MQLPSQETYPCADRDVDTVSILEKAIGSTGLSTPQTSRPLFAPDLETRELVSSTYP